MPDLRTRALQLLTRRDHSRAELQAKLLPEAESPEALATVLDELEATHLLSDQRFAGQRAMQRGLRYGNTRLRQELRQRGVDETVIAEALPEAGDEAQRCRQVWQRKFGSLPTDARERARQMRFLQYRGFSSTAISQVLRHDGEDEV